MEYIECIEYKLYFKITKVFNEQKKNFIGSFYICELMLLINVNFEVQYYIKLVATLWGSTAGIVPEIVRMDMFRIAFR